MTLRFALLAAAAAVTFAAPAAAQSPQPTPSAAAQATPGVVMSGRKSDKPAFDLTGVWWVNQPEGAGGFKPDPPLKPDAMAVWQDVLKQRAEGKNARDKTGNCQPPGLPLIMTRVYPTQIFHTPKLITMIYEYNNSVRWIWMDGRDHPQGEDLIPTYNGHSVGWWEGDTLVVDTVGMHTDPDIQPGVPHTENLRIVERIKLTPDGFDTHITLYDDSIFTKPWETKKSYKKSDAELQEFVCLQENNNFTTDEDGVLRAIRPSEE